MNMAGPKPRPASWWTERGDAGCAVYRANARRSDPIFNRGFFFGGADSHDKKQLMDRYRMRRGITHRDPGGGRLRQR